MNSTNSTVLIVISIGVFFLFTKPMIADLYTALDQKQQLQDTLDKVRSIGDIQKNLQSQLDQLSPEDKAKVDVLLPSSPDLTKFISDVNALAGRDGISIQNVAYSTAVSNAGQSVSNSDSPSNYNNMNVSFGFKSDYTKLKKFIADIESSLRIVDVRSIGADSASGDKSLGAGIYDYNINTDIYWLKN